MEKFSVATAKAGCHGEIAPHAHTSECEKTLGLFGWCILGILQLKNTRAKLLFPPPVSHLLLFFNLLIGQSPQVISFMPIVQII